MTQLFLYILIFNLGLIIFTKLKDITAEPIYSAILFGDLALAIYAVIQKRSDSIEGALAIVIFMAAVVAPMILERFISWCVRKNWWTTGRLALHLLGFLKPVKDVHVHQKQFYRLSQAVRGDIVEASAEIEAEIRNSSNPLQKQFLIETLLELNVFAGYYKNALDIYLNRLNGVKPVKTTLYMALIRACAETGQYDLMWNYYFQIKNIENNDSITGTTLISSQIIILSVYGKLKPLKEIFGSLKTDHPVFPKAAKLYWTAYASAVCGKLEKAKRIFKKLLSTGPSPVVAKRVTEYISDLPTAPDSPDKIKKIALKVMELSILKLAREGFGRNLVPWATISFIAITSIVFLYQSWRGNITDFANLYSHGANFRHLTFTVEPWRAFTSVFLHAGFLHFFLNMLIAWFMGRITEVHYGNLGMAAIIVISGITGSIVSTFFSPHGIAVGASGAVFGIIGAAITMLVVWKNRWHPQLRRRMLNLLLFMLVVNVIFGIMAKMVDNAAHIGGLMGGSAAAVIMGAWDDQRLFRKILRFVGVLIIIFSIAYSIYGLVRISHGKGRITWQTGDLSFSTPTSWIYTKNIKTDGYINPVSFGSVFCRGQNLAFYDGQTAYKIQMAHIRNPNLLKKENWKSWIKTELRVNSASMYYYYRNTKRGNLGVLFIVPFHCEKQVKSSMESIVDSIK
ncbi:rhomboid family intramembrane serine protease [Myxococcota bacterium]|nr:rhomboid family intramembrane serine protease [Myxococcota bacterium]MBU1380184.1 rhomboid family intramembrane serine protease [Myxococcota bacterium]MBU1497334.1 rhomboid family intramembrane serine protease [Myxococcota bacterium]